MSRRGWASCGIRSAIERRPIHAAYGLYYDNLITGVAGITKGINGRDQGAHARGRAADDDRRVERAGPQAARAGDRVSQSRDLDRSGARDAVRASRVDRRAMRAAGQDRARRPISSTCAGSSSRRRSTTTRSCRRSVPTDAHPISVASPGRLRRCSSTRHSARRGIAASRSPRRGASSNRHQLMMSYTLSKADDNGTDFQSEFIAQDSGRGRNPDDPTGLPLGFDPNSEKGPSLQDQRHRFVASGTYILPKDVELSSIVTIGSGRPYNILAGVDLKADGDGGATDRARATLASIATSVQRNAGTLPAQATVDLRLARRFPVGRMSFDGIFEVFNLFNRSNYTAVNNIFGTGAYPTTPAADVRPVHAGRAAAAGAAGDEDRVLGDGTANPPARAECRSASARPSSSSPSSRGRARGTC